MKTRSIVIRMVALLLVLGVGINVASADIAVRVELKASDGSPIDGGTVKYNGGGWIPFGTTGDSGLGYTERDFPDSMSNLQIRISHAGISQTKTQNVQIEPNFTFQTVQVIVILRDSQGDGLPAGVVTYTAGKQRNFGTTGTDGEVRKELFPGTYSFRMTYNHTKQTITQNTDTPLVFRTGRVIQGIGEICTHYAASGWRTFTSGIELMPGSRKFRFLEMPDTKYEVKAGLILTIPSGNYIDSPPTMDPIAEPQGEWYSSTPVISHLGFDDGTALDDGWYQIDSYTGGWTSLFTDVSGKSWDTYNWTVPGFNAFSEGGHTIYFKASNDFGNVEGDSGEWSWQFYKDTHLPTDPTFVSSDPPLNIWTSGNTFVVNWIDGFDPVPGSGLAGYSIEWTTSLTTLPDETQDIPAGVQTATSPDLPDGQWYFHMRAVDSAGNWQSTVHWGPRKIDKTHAPTMEPIVEPESQCYSKAPIFANFKFDDDYALDDGWYQIDSYNRIWVSLFADVAGASWYYDDWPIPGFDSLSEGSHTIYFKATDDAGNCGGGVKWSWQFYKDTEPPTRPVLLYPPDGALLTNHTPTLAWHKSKDGDSEVAEYELMYANNPTFSWPNIVVQYVTDTTYTLPSPIVDDTIYWAVKAIDAAGNSSVWSGKRHFTYDVEAPLPPNLVSPVGGCWLTDISVTLEWISVTYKEGMGSSTSEHYILEVDDNDRFSSPLTDTTDVTFYTSTLSEGFYYWRVKAYDAESTYSDFSNADSFGIDLMPPSKPILIYPSDSLVIRDQVLRFSWHGCTDALSGVDQYLLLYSSSPTFKSYCTDTVNLTDTFCVADSLADGHYWWYVQSVDKAGNIASSKAWKVTINTRIPKVPVLKSPADSSYINKITPTFAWSSTSNTYTLQVASDTTFDALIIDKCGIADTFYAVTDSTLFGSLTYYWRVESVSDAGNLSGYQVHPSMFIVDTDPPTFTGTTVWTDTNYSGPYPVSSVITDAGSDISSAFIYYSFDECSTWNAISIQVSLPNIYKAYIPEVIEANNAVHYYLEAKDFAGNIEHDPRGGPLNPYSFVGALTGSENTGIAEQDKSPTVSVGPHNRPNPFAHSTNICYQLSEQSHVRLTIYNVTGQEIETLVNGKQEAGHYEVKWDRKDEVGKPVTDGVYFYKIQILKNSGNSIHTYVNKMVLLR